MVLGSLANLRKELCACVGGMIIHLNIGNFHTAAKLTPPQQLTWHQEMVTTIL